MEGPTGALIELEEAAQRMSFRKDILSSEALPL